MTEVALQYGVIKNILHCAERFKLGQARACESELLLAFTNNNSYAGEERQ